MASGSRALAIFPAVMEVGRCIESRSRPLSSRRSLDRCACSRRRRLGRTDLWPVDGELPVVANVRGAGPCRRPASGSTSPGTSRRRWSPTSSARARCSSELITMSSGSRPPPASTMRPRASQRRVVASRFSAGRRACAAAAQARRRRGDCESHPPRCALEFSAARQPCPGAAPTPMGGCQARQAGGTTFTAGRCSEFLSGGPSASPPARHLLGLEILNRPTGCAARMLPFRSLRGPRGAPLRGSEALHASNPET